MRWALRKACEKLGIPYGTLSDWRKTVNRAKPTKEVTKENFILLEEEKRRLQNGITKADINAQMTKNLIKRDFTATESNKKWLIDITEVACNDDKYQWFTSTGIQEKQQLKKVLLKYIWDIQVLNYY